MSNKRWEKIREALPGAILSLLGIVIGSPGARHIIVLVVVFVVVAVYHIWLKWGGD